MYSASIPSTVPFFTIALLKKKEKNKFNSIKHGKLDKPI